jgi:hypothetical protein
MVEGFFGKNEQINEVVGHFFLGEVVSKISAHTRV